MAAADREIESGGGEREGMRAQGWDERGRGEDGALANVGSARERDGKEGAEGRVGRSANRYEERGAIGAGPFRAGGRAPATSDNKKGGYGPLRTLSASLRKELLINVRSWRVLAYSLFLAALLLLGSYLPPDTFPYKTAISQGPLVVLAALGCAFVFGVDAISREHERGTAPLLFGTPASRGVMLAAKALVPIIAWLLTLAALCAVYLTQGLGEQFAILWLARLLSATLLFFAGLSLLLLISAAVRGRGAPFAGLVAVLLIFFTSGYFPVEMAGGAMILSPGYHEYLTTVDLVDGALDSPLPAAALALEAAAFAALAGWFFRRSEVVR